MAESPGLFSNTSAPGKEILALRDVSYIFAENRVNALQKLSLEFKKGELCFLIGENGAGKSTLAKLCSGFFRPRSGYILLNKKPYVPRSPRIALRKGIALVPQHPDIVGKLKVWENLALAGHVPGVNGPFRMLRPRALINRYENLLKTFNVEIRLEALANTLSAAEIHWLAIAEALVRRPSFLFLDEPTAPYTAQETQKLYTILKQACSLGMGVVIISHRLEEVFAHGDRVVVLREGKLTLDTLVGQTSMEEITKAMFKEEPVINPDSSKEKDFLPSPLPKPLTLEKGREVLNCSALEFTTPVGSLLKRVTFSVHSGEIVGIVSPQSRSVTILEDLLSCMRPSPRGCLTLNGNPWPRTSAGLRKAGVRYIPSRRFKRGIAETLDLHDNIVGFRSKDIYKGGLWSQKRFQTFARYLPFLIQKKWRTGISTLSGGTIQRVILNRELGEPTPPLVLCFEPSWGLDRKLQGHMHEHLKNLASRGSAILFVGSDRDEVAAISTRLYELKKHYLREVQP